MESVAYDSVEATTCDFFLADWGKGYDSQPLFVRRLPARQYLQPAFLKLSDWLLPNFRSANRDLGHVSRVNDSGHMTNIATMPMYGINFWNIRKNQMTDCLETNTVSDSRVLSSLCKWWPWADLDFSQHSQICFLVHFVSGNAIK